MTCSSSVGLVIRYNNATSLVKSQLRRQTDVCCHFDVGGHGRAHGGRVPPVPRGGYAPEPMYTREHGTSTWVALTGVREHSPRTYGCPK